MKTFVTFMCPTFLHFCFTFCQPFHSVGAILQECVYVCVCVCVCVRVGVLTLHGQKCPAFLHSFKWTDVPIPSLFARH
uniref:Putative secreted protein n=1 Tax=Anopheles darlingi TaxID=43151 RepID=A0A2M4D7R8_ANODA